jgi:conjugal transfer pilus assembly protein TraW
MKKMPHEIGVGQMRAMGVAVLLACAFDANAQPARTTSAGAPSQVTAAPPRALLSETLGTTYEIKEPSLFEQFQKWLEAKRASGELARIEKEAIERSKNSINSPAPVAGIQIARDVRQWNYDPSIVATQDVRDHDGRLIVAKGTKVSPLDQLSWKPMVFIDARDGDQVNFAKRQMAAWHGRGKTVLVAGNWQQLAKTWGEHVYYDQAGTLVKRFGIAATPATVVQAGRVLQISEIPSNSMKVQ